MSTSKIWEEAEENNQMDPGQTGCEGGRLLAQLIFNNRTPTPQQEEQRLHPDKKSSSIRSRYHYTDNESQNMTKKLTI
jgi:hypothetical protein